MAEPVVVVVSGGVPVVDATPESGTALTNPTTAGVPVTPVESGGRPVTIVASGAPPIVFIAENGVDYLLGGSGGSPPVNTLVAGSGSFVFSADAMTPIVDHILPTTAGSFTFTGTDATLTASGGSFVGIGDVTSSALVYHGLRAYNAAYATGSNPAIDIVDQAGANDLTVNILSDGSLDVASISSWVTANSVTTIKVKQIYDQIGTRHLITAGAGGTLAQMPTLVLNGFGSHPVVRVSDTNPQSMDAASSLAQAQSYTVYTVAKRTSGTTGPDIIYGGTLPGSIYFSGANTAGLFAGGTVDFGSGSVTDNSFWTLQALFAGASSKGAYGATTVTGLNPGTDAIDEPGLSNPSFPTNMDWFEGCVWAGDQSASFGSHNTNATGYWGH